MKNYIYVCNDCFYTSNEDFWDCPKCLDETKVTQIQVKQSDKAIVFSFYKEDKLGAETCHNIVEHYVKSNEITYNLIYSQHNYQLEGIHFEVIVKLS
jgi:predicted ATP-dependent serine protease